MRMIAPTMIELRLDFNFLRSIQQYTRVSYTVTEITLEL